MDFKLPEARTLAGPRVVWSRDRVSEIADGCDRVFVQCCCVILLGIMDMLFGVSFQHPVPIYEDLI